MKKYLILLTLLLNIGLLYPHCQVPCGIYDDAVRIVTIKEDFATISKAMVEIKTLSAKNDPQSLNQLNRWIVTKEEHATNIQKVWRGVAARKRWQRKIREAVARRRSAQVLLAAQKRIKEQENRRAEEELRRERQRLAERP